ncbi:MAG TPA: DUF6600 domain-containing protein, partial [Bacteroidota bacterium]
IIFILGFLGFLPLFQSADTIAKGHMQSMAVGVRVGHAGFFYQSLRPHGEWVELSGGFYGWRPVRVRAGWRPYLHGRWAWTDYGWYWMSYEPFGWAVFHYGRWYFDDYYGWIWIPDDVWGPAWVEWRYNDSHIGWAPLPPYASFSISIGIRFTTRWYAPSNYWCFVPYGRFSATRVDGYVVNESHTRRLIRTTRAAMRYEVDRDRVINRGVDRELIERRGNTRIARTEVAEARERHERITRDGNRERIEVYRPSRTDFERGEERIEARRLERRTSLNLERVERGRGTERSGVEGDRQTRKQFDRQESRPEAGRETPKQNERSVTPQQRERSSEFRRVEPDRTTIERRSTPNERSQSSVKSEPRKQSSPQGRGSSRSGRGKRGD